MRLWNASRNVYIRVCTLSTRVCIRYVNVTSLYKYEPERKAGYYFHANHPSFFSLFLSGKTTFVSDGRLAFPRSTLLGSIEFSLIDGLLPRKLSGERERHMTERISPSREAARRFTTGSIPTGIRFLLALNAPIERIKWWLRIFDIPIQCCYF